MLSLFSSASFLAPSRLAQVLCTQGSALRPKNYFSSTLYDKTTTSPIVFILT